MARTRKKGRSKEGAEAQDVSSQRTSEPAPKVSKSKPKSASETRKIQIDGIKKTVYSSLLGVLAGFACFYGPPATISQLPWHFVLLMVLAITYFVQRLTYPFMNIDVLEFKGKDWFYVEFMVVDLWLVTWTLLLN
jgi:phage shock protein PspC (stress-responsive transcriptional regulator)